MFNPKGLFVILYLLFGLSVPALANTRIITTTTDVQDAHDGLCSLREAITSINSAVTTDASCGTISASDDIIQLDNTTYCLNSQLGISKSVTLSGTSDGASTLDGGNSSDTICTTASNDRILSINADGITVKLNDVIIKGGLTDRDGGGIYLSGSSTLSLNQSQVVSNQVVGTDGASGGGIYASNCEALNLTNSIVTDNSVSTSAARALGGGVYAIFCDTVNMDKCSFDQNQSTTSFTDIGAYGGGFFASTVTTTTITNSTFSNNKATPRQIYRHWPTTEVL